MFARIELEAKNKSNNLNRYYNIVIFKNLFGELSLQTVYGRIGQKGQTKTYIFPEKDECLKKLKQILKKRLQAKKRIGVDYEIIHKKLEDINIDYF